MCVVTIAIFAYYINCNFIYIFQVYFKNVHPKFPEGGKLSQYLENMKLNDTIDVRGPSGRLQYTGNGLFLIKKLRKDPPNKVMVKQLNMIAGKFVHAYSLLYLMF